MFVEGDKVLYPHHGAAVVESVVERDVAGKSRMYLTLRIRRGDLTIMVPADAAEGVGVREVASRTQLDRVFELLQQPEGPMPELWSQRYKSNLEKLVTGDLLQGAELIRDLSLRDRRRGISTAEKRLLQKARDILASELTFALDCTEEKAGAMIDDALGEAEAPAPQVVPGR